MAKSKKKGLPRLFDAFFYSLDGIKESFKTEIAFRQEVCISLILIPFALIANVAITEKLFLITSIFLILLFELINSALEACVDRISDEYHDLSKKAKDIGSAAVFVAIINAVITWTLVFS